MTNPQDPSPARSQDPSARNTTVSPKVRTAEPSPEYSEPTGMQLLKFRSDGKDFLLLANHAATGRIEITHIAEIVDESRSPDHADTPTLVNTRLRALPAPLHLQASSVEAPLSVTDASRPLSIQLDAKSAQALTQHLTMLAAARAAADNVQLPVPSTSDTCVAPSAPLPNTKRGPSHIGP